MGWGALFFSIVVWFKVFEEMSLLLFEVLALLLVADAGFVELDIFVCRHGYSKASWLNGMDRKS